MMSRISPEAQVDMLVLYPKSHSRMPRRCRFGFSAFCIASTSSRDGLAHLHATQVMTKRSQRTMEYDSAHAHATFCYLHCCGCKTNPSLDAMANATPARACQSPAVPDDEPPSTPAPEGRCLAMEGRAPILLAVGRQSESIQLMSQRPNILLIHSDQHRADCLGLAGHPLLRTPHLDRLAAQGTWFTHAFTPSPICAPARSSLLSGLWPTQHGCIANGDTEAFRPMVPGLTTFSQTLRDAGYRTAYIGKWHIPEVPPTEFGFASYVPLSGYDDWRELEGLPPVPNANGWFGEVDLHIRADQHRLAWGADRTIEALRSFARAREPFLLRWDPSEPHLPSRPPEPYGSMYPPEQIPPWPSFPDALAGKPYIQRQQRLTWEVEGWSWEQWAPIVSRCLGVITLMDEQIGRLLDALNRLGLDRDTLVVYTADHGDLCGGHGMVDKHYVMYEDVVRVPLILHWPGRLEAGARCDAFVSNEIDLPVTFCDAAGIQPPGQFMGRSLLAAAEGADPQPRQDIFATYHGNQFGLFSQRMVRDRRWKYIWNATAEDELYDLQRDPGELVNLAAAPEHAAQLNRLRRRLIDWMEQTQDRLLNEWTRRQLEQGLST
jgi:arylsulfatase A-like enzyme